MKDSIAPRAVNIIRPHKQKEERFIATTKPPSKIITSTIHTSKQISFNLYDPKKTSLNRNIVQPLVVKKQHNIEIYDPKKIKTLNNRNTIRGNPAKFDYNPPKQNNTQEQPYFSEQEDRNNQFQPNTIQEDLLMTHEEEQQEIVSQESISETEDSDEGEEDEDEETQDILSEARINRKIADLEISNKSLLVINEMLESTVRNQAKQIASLKNRPSETANQEKKKVEEILLLSENDEENDEQFDRLLHITELLINEAQNAVDHTVQETGGKVITGYHHEYHSVDKGD